MCLIMTELRDDVLLAPDPNFNPNVFSEDEEEYKGPPLGSDLANTPPGAIPIAPMTPKNLRQGRGTRYVIFKYLSYRSIGI